MIQLSSSLNAVRLTSALILVLLWSALWIPQTNAAAFPQSKTDPPVSAKTVFGEKDGLVAVEAEHFFSQTLIDQRQFYLTTQEETPSVGADGDPNHSEGASGGGYLEVLPDTRRTHDDKLKAGVNFFPKPGQQAILSYQVNVTKPGRYYVWARAYSTGGEDNGLHVGLDDQWPESGQRLQWCTGKNSWRWESKQRTKEKHCGEPGKIYLDIEKAGDHVVHFSMREDGFEFDKWLMTLDKDFKRPDDAGPMPIVASGPKPKLLPMGTAAQEESTTKNSSDLPLVKPRQPDGDGSVAVAGEKKVWHKLSLDIAGPYAHEHDNQPNPFTDHRLLGTFTHEDGTSYQVPGFFAADGDAANSSAVSGTLWRVNFVPDRAGRWDYEVQFHTAKDAAIDWSINATSAPACDGKTGSFQIADSDKPAGSFAAEGRLQYVGQRYLKHASSGRYFLKVGADSPETLLAFKDFDNTSGGLKKAPLKSFSAHVADWKPGDPSWGNGRGKGLIGAISYLSSKGANAFSFLTYNAGGDGNSVWPYVQREDKLHFDCSKLDQWGIVFDYGTDRNMYLHFKLQETENDDNIIKKGKKGFAKESLDGGDLGRQRKVYLKELIARFGHALALNWNLGEENTQTTKQQKAMIDYIKALDPYGHNIVIHTYPKQQDKVYGPLLGEQSGLTGASLQNSSIRTTHEQTLKWVTKSTEAGKPWVIAFDESGSAAHGCCPDLGYEGFDGKDSSGKMIYTQHDVRKQTLWGNLMAGGAGCEYYFGYKFAQNDLMCEDWRSRDQSWDYGRIALSFFHDQKIPFHEMKNQDSLVKNKKNSNKRYCFAKSNEVYLVYLPEGGSCELDLSEAVGKTFAIHWFNPRSGGELANGSVAEVQGGAKVALGNPPQDAEEDWLVVVR